MTDQTTNPPAEDVDAGAAAAAGAKADAGTNADAGAPADAAAAGGGEKDVQAIWPTDWREQMAGGDEKALKQLKRFNSPLDVGKSWRAADQRINSDEFIPKLPADASEEQIKAWREKVGIPETHEGYLEKLSNGLTIGEDDKPILDSFLKTAHGKNMTPDSVDAALQWYYQEQEARMDALVEQDKGDKQTGEDELRALWGQDYRPNMNMMNAFLDTAPEGVKDLILNGRGSDGVVLGNNPQVLDFFTRLAKEMNPSGIIEQGAAASGKGVDERLAEIAKYRRENRDKYYKDEKVLEEERRLLSAQQRMKAAS